MSFDLKSFAEQVRPTPKKSSRRVFNDSVFDAGSPQYIRPEDLFLDIQSRLFNIKALSTKELGGIDPSDFKERWLRNGVSQVKLQRVGPTIENENLADSVMALLRCPKRPKERYPTLLPAAPSLGFYKNIKPNLPNFYNDQFRPALTFADETAFGVRIAALKNCLATGTNADDSLKQLSFALLPFLQAAAGAHPTLSAQDGPLLKNFSVTPSEPLAICQSLATNLDALIALEPKLPRIQWTRWLTAMLRLWLPLFFLKRCAVSASAANAMKNALSSGVVPAPSALSIQLCGSNGLLRGSSEWLNQLAPIVQNYVRSRFEFSILLELSNLVEWLTIQGLDPTKASDTGKIQAKLDEFEVDLRRATNLSFPNPVGVFDAVRLSMPGDVGPGRLPFDVWLKWLTSHGQALDALAKLIGANGTIDLVERVYAYVRPGYEPLKTGFGKNAYEYVLFALGAPRKSERDPEIPDEFNLIFRGEGGRRSRQVMIQPGPQLLQLLVQLVVQKGQAPYHEGAKLSDLLDLFESLHIDFRSNPDDFEGLKSELLRLGLLQSSADAAEAASLSPAYAFSITP